jgi:hypothetical protein
MARFGMADLRNRALAAVDEAATKSHKGPVERTLALRFALAFLANFADERWPFDRFWKALQEPRENERWAGIISARNAIYRAVGSKPQRNV